MRGAVSEKDAISRAPELLRERARELAKRLGTA